MTKQEDIELDVTAYLKTESERQQFETLMRAFEIFRDRTETRGDLWAEFDSSDAVRNMESKLARVRAAFQSLIVTKKGTQKAAKLTESIIDDSLDLCNYAVFLIRHIEGATP